jgi:hypothetical protein
LTITASDLPRPPAEVAARYRAIDVILERADGDRSGSDRSVLRGSYA